MTGSTPSTLRRLARLVLVWYMLFVGVSVLTSALQPANTMTVVCSTMGVMKMVVGDDGTDTGLRTGMDCPMCAHATPALPLTPALADSVHAASALSYALNPWVEAHLIARSAPPLPSRGPPVFN
jgi:hypothetical protein